MFWKKYRVDVKIAFVLLLICAFAYRKIVFYAGNYSIAGDTVSYFNCQLLYLRNVMLNYYTIPLWNDLYLSGLPYHENSLSLIFYIFTPIILFFKNIAVATRIMYFLHVFLSGTFFYYLMQSLRCDRLSSLISSTGYMLCGALLARIEAGHCNLILPYCWIPLTVAFCWKALTEMNIKYSILSGISLGMQVLNSGGIIAIHSSMLVGVIVFLSVITNLFGKRFKILLINLANGVLIFVSFFLFSVIKILPTLHFLPYSYRKGWTLKFLEEVSFQKLSDVFQSLVSKDVPSFNFIVQSKGWFEFCYYIGYPLFFLSVIGIFFNRTKKTFFFLISLIVFLFLSMGKYAPIDLFAIGYHIFPVFKSMQILPRFMIIGSFCLIVIAGLGASTIYERMKKLNIKLTSVVFMVLLIFIIFDFSSFISKTLNLAKVKNSSDNTSINPNTLSALAEISDDIVIENKQLNFNMSIMNIGDTIWLKENKSGSKGAVKLALIYDNQSPIYFDMSKNVYPNEIISFPISLEVPLTNGLHELKIGIIDTGIKWFDSSSPDPFKTAAKIKIDDSNISFDKKEEAVFMGVDITTWFRAKTIIDKEKFRVFSSPYPLLQQYSALINNIKLSSGVDAGMLDYYVNSFLQIKENSFPLDEYSPKLLGILNTKYIVADKELNMEGLKRINAPALVYQNELFQPMFYFVNNVLLFIGEDHMNDLNSREVRSMVVLHKFDPSNMCVFRGNTQYLEDYDINFLKKFNAILLGKTSSNDYKKTQMIIGQCEDNNIPLIQYTYDETGMPNMSEMESKKIFPDNKKVDKLEQDIKILYQNPNRTKFKIKTLYKNQFLVRSESYFYGWEAYLDGRRTPVFMVNGSVQGVLIEKEGDHILEFKYVPVYFRLGAFLTVSFIISCLVYIIRISKVSCDLKI